MFEIQAKEVINQVWLGTNCRHIAELTGSISQAVTNRIQHKCLSWCIFLKHGKLECARSNTWISKHHIDDDRFSLGEHMFIDVRPADW